MSPVVLLITGCSSGLGRALALDAAGQLDASGQPLFRVYATARRPATLEGLPSGVQRLQLDVTNDQSVKTAVAAVLQAEGRIDALINNAGLSRVGPLAEQPLSAVREVMEANFFGALRMVQAVAPSMAERHQGLIVNIGSVVSWITSPYSGTYSASKAALLSASLALRMELKPFGVDVTYVAAGAIKSQFGNNASADLDQWDSPTSLYHSVASYIRARAQAGQDPRATKTAEQTSAQIMKVVVAAVSGSARSRGSGAASWWARVTTALGLGGGSARRPAAAWFLAGGQAVNFFLWGLWQRTLGWPVTPILERRFGLARLAAEGPAHA